MQDKELYQVIWSGVAADVSEVELDIASGGRFESTLAIREGRNLTPGTRGASRPAPRPTMRKSVQLAGIWTRASSRPARPPRVNFEHGVKTVFRPEKCSRFTYSVGD